MARADASPATPAGPDEARRVRTLITPEGVDLRLVLASAGDRASAFLLDVAIIMGALVAATLAILLVALALPGPWVLETLGILWLLVSFGLRNAYFIVFELRPGSATPGKRALGLRVASRDGRPLSGDAVFARNAMRELEVFLPLSFLMARGAGVDGWIVLAGIVWSGVFALFPLFNRDHLRVGDLVAGTWVVRTPRLRLLPDLAEGGADGPPRFAFTSVQLDAYGIKELQVLEGVIRRGDRKVTAAVAERIRNKIGWPRNPAESDYDFLSAYYTGLRGRLENRLLFGRRRKDKHDV